VLAEEENLAMEMEEGKENREIESENCFEFPKWREFRRKVHPDDPFFAPANLQREILAKQVGNLPQPYFIYLFVF